MTTTRLPRSVYGVTIQAAGLTADDVGVPQPDPDRNELFLENPTVVEVGDSRFLVGSPVVEHAGTWHHVGADEDRDGVVDWSELWIAMEQVVLLKRMNP